MSTTTTSTARTSMASLSVTATAAKPSSRGESSTAATLRSLYNRAAKAFLQRDAALTSSLLASGFALLPPPPATAKSYIGPADALDAQRRKWDILRITLETTLYGAPAGDLQALPASLRTQLLLSAPALVAAMYTRSLALFTPAGQPANPAFVPAQILVTLVLSALKLECAEAGRSMVEDWLGRRIEVESTAADAAGYERVLELYCLEVLPRLDEWDYAQEFISYERELQPQARNTFIASLNSLHEHAVATQADPGPSRTPTPTQANVTYGSAPRSPPSPAPSASTSSSISTTSTRTVRPSTRPNGLTSLNGNGSATAPARSKSRSQPRSAGKGKQKAEPHTNGHAHLPSDALPPQLPRAPPEPTIARRAPSFVVLAKTYLAALAAMERSKLVSLLFVFVLLPALSLALRLRRRGAAKRVGVRGVAEDVRRRLRAGAVAGSGAFGLGWVWGEAVRAIVDTVGMAGRGLV